MAGLFRGLYHGWRERRQARADEVLDSLKSRYHTFRVLLENNEQALRQISDIDTLLAGRDRSAVDARLPELLEVIFELVDGLNRLTGNHYQGLYGRFDRLEQGLRAQAASAAQDLAAAPLCVDLDELGRDLDGLAGGKAANLAALRRMGAPVPDGFVATTAAGRRFLAASGLEERIRQRLREIESSGAVEGVTSSLQEAIMAAEVPADVAEALLAQRARLAEQGVQALAVRSSALVEDRADHSFAGQFSSVLNVTGDEGLLEAFKRVVASNFAARPVSYRREGGMPLADFEMAVLCLAMVPARTAGVLLSVDPAAPGRVGEGGHMLLTAVAGLGTQAVGGSAPADIYRPPRSGWREGDGTPAHVADKARREVVDPSGGLRLEETPEESRHAPALSPEEVRELARWGALIESLNGVPQDIEWVFDDAGRLHLLQARPLRLPAPVARQAEAALGNVVLDGAASASPGRTAGRAVWLRSLADVDRQASVHGGDPRILLLSQSLPDAARLLSEAAGVAVELGNPTDHLSCVAREHGVPMLTGCGPALEQVGEGQWLVLDADRGRLVEPPEQVWAALAGELASGLADLAARSEHKPGEGRGPSPLPPGLARLRELVVPLHLTDAYGPMFSILECRSLHDIVRFVHEKAVVAMFDVGDLVIEEAGSLVRPLEGVPFHFLVIDLGGGLAPGRGAVELDDVLCAPLAALCRGMGTPGLRWTTPPPVMGLSGLVGRSLSEGGARPVGSFNYALVTRDYLNLNARVDYHFAMVDALSGPNSREGYVRFRFKGGGTSQIQRERRTRFIEEVLQVHGFITDRRSDLVTGSFSDAPREAVAERLEMLGRLIGFSRLLDAAMADEDMPHRIAQAFLEGDYQLVRLKDEEQQTQA